MKKDRFTREQRRHGKFVLQSGEGFIAFAKDGVSYGLREFKFANVFDYKKADLLKRVIEKPDLDIMVKLLVKDINGKVKAV